MNNILYNLYILTLLYKYVYNSYHKIYIIVTIINYKMQYYIYKVNYLVLIIYELIFSKATDIFYSLYCN